MKRVFRFASDDFGKTLTELGYEQINSNARFIFFRPITISASTKIEFDPQRGTFHLLSSEYGRELLEGKWDR